jgi:hypothetical protein
VLSRTLLIRWRMPGVAGGEIEVLKGVDHSQFRFRYACVECREIGRLEPFLVSHGYQLVDQLSVRDYLFCSCTGVAEGGAS